MRQIDSVSEERACSEHCLFAKYPTNVMLSPQQLRTEDRCNQSTYLAFVTTLLGALTMTTGNHL